MYFDYQGNSIYYEVHGQGNPLLILNGIMMSTQSWQEFIKPLTQFNQLILVDFVDQGQSDKMTEVYDHIIQVDLVKSLVDHLELEKVNIYGVSYGGEIAIQVALKYPDIVDKLCLFNTCAETSYWLSELGNAWNAASQDGLAYYLTTIPIIYSPKFFNKNRAWMEKRKQILVPLFSDKEFISSMVRLTNSSLTYASSGELEKIKHNTLIVGCEYDFLTPFYQQEELHQKMKNSDLVYIPDSGHALMYEKPELFVSLILGFINNDKQQYRL